MNVYTPSPTASSTPTASPSAESQVSFELIAIRQSQRLRHYRVMVAWTLRLPPEFSCLVTVV